MIKCRERRGRPESASLRSDEMYINTKGLVLRETPYKETSRILTVLTSDLGKQTVTARGAKRKGSRLAGACQLLAFSDMTLYGNRGRFVLTEARPIELFEGLRTDLDRLSLGSYFAEILEAVSNEDIADPEMMSLGLNALYLLSEGKRDEKLIKCAFELRCMCLAGFEPELSACSVCGREDVSFPRLELLGGTVRCRDCLDEKASGKSAALCTGSLAAMRHIAHSEAKKVFSFSLGEDALERLSAAAEGFLITQLDRGFGTLSFYKSIKEH